MLRLSYPLAIVFVLAALAPMVHAQAPAPAVAPAPATGTVAPPVAPGAEGDAPPQVVTITGKKSTPTGESLPVFTAKKRMLRGSLAEKCQLDTPYSSTDDDMENYLEQLSEGPGEVELNEDGTPVMPNDPLRQKLSINSPMGDVSTMVDSSSVKGTGSSQALGPCGARDRRFAAGRGRILSKDKSFAEGLDAYSAKDYARAIEQFKIAYDKIGYPEAAAALGKIYLNGQGVPRDVAMGKSWLLKAIDEKFNPHRDRLRFDPKDPEGFNGRIEATLVMAKMSLYGIGARKDPAEACKWYARAAEFGYVPALNTLGLAAQSGVGGPKDAAKARAYFQEAAEAGYLPAQFNLAKMYYLGTQG
ncbi:MAG: tetratricopeptide repeat protein, partial [Massilia sp.]